MKCVLEELSNYDVKSYISNKFVKLKSFQFYIGEGKCSKFILYICSDSMLPQLIENGGFNILCVSTPESELKKQDNVNIIYLKSDEHIYNVYNKLFNIFKIQSDLLQEHKAILDILSNNNSIKLLISEGIRMLHNPIKILNHKFEILYDSNLIDANVNLFEDYEKDEREIQQLFDSKKGNKIIQKLSKSRIPIIVENESIVTGLGNREIWHKIMLQGRHMGYIVVSEFLYPVGECDFSVVSMLGKAFSVAMRIDKYTKSSNERLVDSIILEMLSGNNSSEYDDLERYLSNLGRDISGEFIVLVIHDNQKKPNKISLRNVIWDIDRILIYSKCIQYDEKVVAITKINNNKIDSLNRFDELSKYLKDSNMSAGMSRPFMKLNKLKKYYKQANDALRVGNIVDIHCVLNKYDDYIAFYPMELYRDVHMLKDICHPSIMKLYEYDKEKGTDLLKTLYVYLENKSNVVETANILNIHRNTLYYRLDRIQEIGELMIESDDNGLLNIWYSLKIFLFIGNFSIENE